MPKLSLYSLLATLMALFVDSTFAADATLSPKEIRVKAKEVFAVLPDKMPGAEHDTPALVDLGKKLFFEKRLSANNTQSCNSCHAVDQNRGGVDNEPTSPGAFGKRGGRNSPTVLNAGFHLAQFWDGRAAKLEDQAKGPILNPIEMAMPADVDVIKRLRSWNEYGPLFSRAFPKADEKITYDNVARAIAAFERTLITRDRFDDFLKGDDRALTSAELRGLQAFMQIGCTTCHNGPVLGGNSYQKAGLVNPYPFTQDEGRFAVTKDESDKGKMKVPSLRNIALTHPYFHDGQVAKLHEAVGHMAWMQLGLKLEDAQIKEISAFLNALSDKPRAQTAQR